MKYLLAVAYTLTATIVSAAPLVFPVEKRSSVYGVDVSDYQTDVDWETVKSNGIGFAYIKATEGTSYESPEFGSQYDGAYDQNIIRGAYHFAHPDESSGATQADYFVAHGGGWSDDGLTLPGALDIEYNPDGAECYGLSQSAMVSWIKDFSSTYYSKTTRYPVIYSTTDWWTTCTGDSSDFADNNPFWVADYASNVGSLPAGYSYYTFWQYADSGANPGDADVFNGSLTNLKKLATG